MLITAILVQTVAREVGLKKTCSTTIYTFEVITRSMRLGLYSRPFCLDFYFLLHPLRQKPLWGSLENSRLAPCESSASWCFFVPDLLAADGARLHSCTLYKKGRIALPIRLLRQTRSIYIYIYIYFCTPAPTICTAFFDVLLLFIPLRR